MTDQGAPSTEAGGGTGMQQFEFHPFADIFPLIEGADFDALVADVRANGLHQQIDIYQSKILDGRNRYRAAQAAGLELAARDFRYFRPELHGDPLDYVRSQNVHRRHLSPSQRALVASEFEAFRHGGDRKGDQDANLHLDRAAVADAWDVSTRSVASAAKVRNSGAPELKRAVRDGKMSISRAALLARGLSVSEQRDVIAHCDPKAVAAVARELRGGAVNGARAIMGSRLEPDDSLDYFPTPPWATRALFEHVLTHLKVPHVRSAWDPGCGEGHMAEAMRAYVTGPVHASDIHDYRYGDVLDYLAVPPRVPEGAAGVRWIITNPPFGDNTEAFFRRAVAEAGEGVALFVRLQWLETKGRYERIFRDNPPTLIAFFAERVPLCKGRWNPDGDTATAYIWLVWMKGRTPQAPFWIPPTCRQELERPGDVEQYTASPVIRKLRPIKSEPAMGYLSPVVDEPATETPFQTGPSPAAPIGPAAEVPHAAAEGPAAAHVSLPPPADSITPDDDLDIPDFLKRAS